MLIGWPTSNAPARAVSGARKISVSGGGGGDVCAKSASATTDTYRMSGIIWRDVEREDRKDHRHAAIASARLNAEPAKRAKAFTLRSDPRTVATESPSHREPIGAARARRTVRRSACAAGRLAQPDRTNPRMPAADIAFVDSFEPGCARRFATPPNRQLCDSV